MAAGVIIKHKRKAGAFADGELAAGEYGLDTTNRVWYFSANGTTVIPLRTLRRVLPLSSNSATPTINTDNCDVVRITGQSANISSFTTNLTGAPVAGDTLWLTIVPTGTITIAYGAKFEDSSAEAPVSITGETDIGFRWNPTSSKWRCVAVA